MYLARIRKNGRTHYQLRESVRDEERWTYRKLAEIGPDPSKFIVYPGGNAFYIDEAITDKLNPKEADDLEDLLWPFVRQDVRRAVGSFRSRALKTNKFPKPTPQEEDRIRRSVPSLDKRRAHYLKFGNMDQGPSVRMPVVVFRHLTGKSRDEIEQHFIEKEVCLDDSELKSYVYTAFNLQRFFPSRLAKKMPHVLDQDRVDSLFVDEICRVNRTLFGKTMGLDEYLRRYLIMFFDHEYAGTTLLNDYVNDFIHRRRAFHNNPPAEPRIDAKEACRVFGIDEKEVKTMTRRRLTRIFRRLAKKCHPDKGGSKEKFVELTNSYQMLSREIGLAGNHLNI